MTSTGVLGSEQSDLGPQRLQQGRLMVLQSTVYRDYESKIGLYALCAQQMLIDRNICVIPIIKDMFMSKCGRNVLKTQRYDSVLSPLFSYL